MSDGSNNNHPGKPKPLSKEVLAAQLRDRQQERRPNRFVALLVLFLLFAVPLGLLVWWFWPGPTPPDATVIAFDAVATPGQEVALVARIQLRDGKAENARLGNWPMLFANDPLQQDPGREEWFQKTQTSALGVATTTRTINKSPSPDSYVAVYAPEEKYIRAEDRALLFCWPKDKSILLVDVERALTGADLKKWKMTNGLGIVRVTEAANALAEANRKKYGIVYLACAVAESRDYLNVRGWLRTTPSDGGERFPTGPVLGRLSYEQNVKKADAQRARIDQMRQKFSGKMMAVTANADTAAVFAKSGAKSLLVGKHKNAPRDVTVIAKWSKLIEKLP